MRISGRLQLVTFAAVVTLGFCPSESNASVVIYQTAGLSGLDSSWPGQSLNPSVTALPGLRGGGLANPGLGFFGYFLASEAATSATLSLANNDYISFGFSVSSAATTQFDVTRFRAFTAGLTPLSQGMQCQLWAVYPNASQPPTSLSGPIPVNASTTPTAVDVAIPPGTIVIAPGESLELRMYYWHAASSANYFALGPDPAASTNPDVIIDANEVPSPGAGALFLAPALICSARRRRSDI